MPFIVTLGSSCDYYPKIMHQITGSKVMLCNLHYINLIWTILALPNLMSATRIYFTLYNSTVQTQPAFCNYFFC